MGLREIDPEGGRHHAARPGDKPGQLVLTQARPDNHGEMLTKETIVNEPTATSRAPPLGRGPGKNCWPRRRSASTSPRPRAGQRERPGLDVELPKKFRLEWVAEKFALDVTMAGPSSTPIPPEQRTALFTEPTIPGTKRMDLANLNPPAAPSSKV